MATNKKDPAAEEQQTDTTAQATAAESKEAETTENTAQKETSAAPATGEEMVTVCLFKDNERYKDDVFVAVNGKTWQIKRGEPVQIPKYVADVLEQSRRQDTATANLIDQESSSYEAEAKARNI